MSKKTLTIFTPAYNRAHTIGRTYESLCRQTCQDFEWLVVDDGSQDHTRTLVDGWIQENKISIRYIYKENGGMHTAHNVAYEHITTELNTCIDSDDYMPDDAVEKIVNHWKKYGSDQYAGILGLDQTIGGKILGERFPLGLFSTTLFGYEAQSKVVGDMKLVLRTDVVKKYPPYPVFEGEKYVGLAYLYVLIDQDYELLALNEVLVIVDYQVGGSTSSTYKQYWHNPKGFAFYNNVKLKYVKTFKQRIKSSILYVANSIRAKNYKMLSESNAPWLTFFLFPVGLAFFCFVYYKYKTNSLHSIKK